MGYIFKRLEPDMFPHLVEISKSAFDIDPGTGYYKSKNNTSLFGEPCLGFVAYDEKDQPAAFYGVYACPVVLNGKSFVAAQSGDTMTHKDHGGKGLFTTLAKMTYELAKEKGIDFIFGFPNANSYPGFSRKLNWTFPFIMKEFRASVFTFPLAKIAKKFTVFTPFYKAYINLLLSFFSSGKSTLVSSAIEKHNGGVNRTEGFMKYKKFSGCRLISVSGCTLLIRIDGRLLLGDLEIKEGVNYGVLFRKLKRLCFFLGIDTIVFQASPGSFFDGEFSKFLGSTESAAAGYLDLSGKTDPAVYRYVYADFDTF